MKELNNKQIEGLQRLLSLLDPDTLTRGDFIKHFKVVVDFVKKIEKKNVDDFSKITKAITEALKTTQDTTSNDFKGLEGNITASLGKKLLEADTTIRAKIADIDHRMARVRDGRDADEKKILKKVLKKIKFPEQVTLDNSEQLRNKLEFLEGEERFDISLIKGLRGMLTELQNRPVGGGTSYMGIKQHFVYAEVPAGTVNGTNAAFTIASTPNPSGSLVVYVNGQRMKLTEDYTVSNLTITFGTAPPTGSILLVDYMK